MCRSECEMRFTCTEFVEGATGVQEVILMHLGFFLSYRVAKKQQRVTHL